MTMAETPRLVLALLLGSRACDATGHGTLGVDQSRAALLRLTASARPEQADEAFDCSWRRLAAEYAPLLQPRFKQMSYAKQLHDALQLEGLCGEPFVPDSKSVTAAAEPPLPQQQPPSPQQAAPTFYVSPSGDDDAAGTLSAPFRTIAAALEAVRRARRAQTADALASIVLRAGTYNLAAPIELFAADSFLSISSYETEQAVLSGGALLSDLAWTQAAPSAPPSPPSSSPTPSCARGWRWPSSTRTRRTPSGRTPTSATTMRSRAASRRPGSLGSSPAGPASERVRSLAAATPLP